MIIPQRDFILIKISIISHLPNLRLFISCIYYLCLALKLFIKCIYKMKGLTIQRILITEGNRIIICFLI